MGIVIKQKLAKFLWRASDKRAKLTGAMEPFGRQEKYGTFGFSFRYSSGAIICGKSLFLQHLEQCPSKPVSGSRHAFSTQRPRRVANSPRHDFLR